MKHLAALLLVVIGLLSCQHPRSEGNEEGYAVIRKNTNLELYADSVALELLPIRDTYLSLYKGAQVVVAEFAIHAEDSVDSVWVKVAHTQKTQGWLRQSELMASFVPVDVLSQFIYVFSHTHVPYFIVIVALFIAAYLFRTFRKKQIRLVYFNDIDSIYPLLLCLLMAISATLYESVQLFTPNTWQQYFYAPTLSPFKVPFLLSAFLISLWLIILVALAAFDDVFGQLSSPSEAFFYMLGLLTACIFCYFFFIATTRYYVGYLFLGMALLLFVRRARRVRIYRYRCGHCRGKLKAKGICPHCGAVNK